MASQNLTPLQRPPKHLLFDLDGTLVRYNHLRVSIRFLRSAIRGLREFGSSWRAFRTIRVMKRAVERVSSETTLQATVLRELSLSLGIPESEAEHMIQKVVFSTFPNLERYFYPMPGAREFLEWAQSRFSLRLATNPVWPRSIVEMRVRWAGIDPNIFQEITHIERMRAAKPHPEYYAQILRESNLNPSDCLLIGNDALNDLSATKVGIPVFLICKKKGIRSLPPRAARAQAWEGGYADLRNLLETALAKTT
jgi:FMN phosphatase YigB (HAD superfamily)